MTKHNQDTSISKDNKNSTHDVENIEDQQTNQQDSEGDSDNKNEAQDGEKWVYKKTRTYERRRRVRPEDLDIHFSSGKQLFIFNSPNYGECSVQMMTNCHKDMNMFYEILFDRHIINEQTAPMLYQATFDETKLTAYSFFKRYTAYFSKGMGLYKVISQEAKFLGIIIIDPECELEKQSQEWLPYSPAFSMYLKPNVHIYHNLWLNGEKYFKEIKQNFIKWFVPRTDFNNFVNATVMALINFSSHPMELELPNKTKSPFYIFRSYPEIFKVFLGEYAYEDEVERAEREEKEKEEAEKAKKLEEQTQKQEVDKQE